MFRKCGIKQQSQGAKDLGGYHLGRLCLLGINDGVCRSQHEDRVHDMFDEIRTF